MSICDVHRTVWCTSPFELAGRLRCRGDGKGDGDGEGEGDSERDEGRRSYLKADGDIDSR